MDATFNTQLNGVDPSLAGYASTADLSTREPTIDTPAHPLLKSFNSLLNSLLIPLSLSSLALATPTLLLTVLEVLLETRIIDVPDDYRGSWERSKRTKIAQVVVQAVGEVLDGLARANGKEVDEEWRREKVEVRGVVRGTEEELAKIVNGLLRIAQGFGVDFESPPPLPATRNVVKGASRTSTELQRPIPLPRKDLSKPPPSNPPVSPSAAPTPSLLFAPRPLRQPPQPLPRSISSSISSSSSRSSHSTSLTIPHPHRPSLFNELERSGTLSPPPRMPGSPRRHTSRSENGIEAREGRKSRSTLELMRERESRAGKDAQSEEEKKDKGKGKGKEREIDDVFSTPRDNDPEKKLRRPAEKAKQKEAGRGVDPGKVEPKVTKDEVAESKKKEREKRAKVKKGKERATEMEEDDDVTRNPNGYSSSSEHECCRDCRAGLTKTSGTTSQASSSTNSDSDPSNRRPRRSHADHFRSSRTRPEQGKSRKKEKWCRCQSGEGDHGDCSSEGEGSSSSTLKKTQGERRHRSDRTKTKKESSKEPRKKTTNDLSASTSSPPARRVRVIRLNRDAHLSSNETGNLSVHAESEIDRFESSRQTFSARDSRASPQPTTPVTPAASTTREETISASTPSPYTMLLLAQRARLAEKLRALELRERDRMAARQAQGTLGT
ncbi:uncharacterized protein JCM6883_002706 [Sporobolomyces salmoneus]|uniref:uncharacterized protein n=1 Tax=Sporobolomyces salmoneus TaxID=183962 RepID=UPI00317D3320